MQTNIQGFTEFFLMFQRLTFANTNEDTSVTRTICQ